MEKALGDISSKYLVDKGTLLISRSGNVGVACVPDTNARQSIISSHIIKVRLKEGYSPFLVGAIINSKIGKLQMLSLINGHLIKEINRASLAELKIPVLKNEKLMVKKLLEAKNNHERASELIQQAQTLFYQSLGINFSTIRKEKYYGVNLSDFRGDDLWSPTFSYPLYVRTLSAIQKRWQTVRLGEIAATSKGDEVGSDHYHKYLDKKDSDVPFVRTSDLVNYEIDLFPDFYVDKAIYKALGQDIKSGDILFTKDGKIGMAAMVTGSDQAIIASGITTLRLEDKAKKYGFTPEYVFLVLSLKETGLFPAMRRTVVASTIPHLREERLKEIEIPMLDKKSMDEITALVKEAFRLKDERKWLIRGVRETLDGFFAMEDVS